MTILLVLVATCCSLCINDCACIYCGMLVMNSEHSCDLKTCSCTVSKKYIGLQVSASIHADSEMLNVAS